MIRKIKKVAAVGTGIMGTQIATLAACRGYEVSAHDRDEQAIQRSLESIRAIIELSWKEPILTPEEWERGAQRVTFFEELPDAVKGADLVIEAVPEDLDLKREIFEQMDRYAPERAILATNSSSIPVSRIETATNRPQLCLNIHFYSLAMGVNMADLMGGRSTAPETLDAAKAWLRSMGCVALPVKKEIKGFCFNRVWRAIKRETLHMWAEGFVDYKDIDRAWMIAYGTPQGPFGMMDRVGLDVVYAIEMSYYHETGNIRDCPPKALKDMVDQNKLGIKTKEGFYSYPDPEYARPGFILP
ncbi:MAG: hypothetical protein JRH06_17065 [Deltaproteobacteria bacterium]|nr:hypothetical protein [Deltaproteobacteria bacterium]MBW2139246.1 hypothetical protein [Deltaproteobacteria bacterium]